MKTILGMTQEQWIKAAAEDISESAHKAALIGTTMEFFGGEKYTAIRYAAQL